MKSVTLYIPCYNASQTIGRCIESALAQVYAPSEIIVIDDHSYDDSIEIIKRYPVTLVKNTRNLGLACCRNKAFELAAGEYVAALDADCVAAADWLATLIPLLETENSAGAGGRLVEGNIVSLADKWRQARMAQEWGDFILNDPPFLYGSNTVFRKEVFDRIGPYNEVLRNNYEDVDFSERLLANGFGLTYTPYAQARHLKSDSVLSLLRSYRRWRQPLCEYGRLNQPHEEKGLRRIVLKTALLFDRAGFFNRALWSDLNNSEYRFLGIDMAFVAYSLFQDAKSVARETFAVMGVK
jgi:GT2 family glycosyltransferase